MGHTKFDMSYIYKKSNAFPAPIFTKPANAQQHYVCVCVYIYSTKFRENWKINMESTDRNSFVSLKRYGLHCTNFHEADHYLINFCGHFLCQMYSKTDKNM